MSNIMSAIRRKIETEYWSVIEWEEAWGEQSGEQWECRSHVCPACDRDGHDIQSCPAIRAEMDIQPRHTA